MVKKHFTFRAGNYDLEESLAGLEGRQRSKFINDALRVAFGKPDMTLRDNQRLKLLLKELRPIGRNINQMARAVNNAKSTGATIDEADKLKDAGKELKAVIRGLEQIVGYWK